MFYGQSHGSNAQALGWEGCVAELNPQYYNKNGLLSLILQSC
jgi:hypothetical protein